VNLKTCARVAVSNAADSAHDQPQRLADLVGDGADL
jgi:hypothetical protein